MGPAIASGSQVCSGNCADFAGHAREEQQGDQRRMVDAAVRDGAEDPGDAEGPGVGGEREQADEEGDVAELGDQEGLQGGGARLGVSQ